MQISELSNWSQPLNKISTIFNSKDYDKFNIEQQDTIQEDTEQSSKIDILSSTKLIENYMDFYQLNDSSFKKPSNSISAFNDLASNARNEFTNSSSQYTDQLSTTSSSSSSQSEKFNNNPIFSNCSATGSCDNQFRPMARNQLSAPQSNFNSNFTLNPQSESNVSNCTSTPSLNRNLINANSTNFIKSETNEQSAKTKEAKIFNPADNELHQKEDNSFYCLSNLINSANDNQMNLFVCLWRNCNKSFSLQRDLVS